MLQDKKNSEETNSSTEFKVPAKKLPSVRKPFTGLREKNHLPSKQNTPIDEIPSIEHLMSPNATSPQKSYVEALEKGEKAHPRITTSPNSYQGNSL